MGPVSEQSPSPAYRKRSHTSPARSRQDASQLCGNFIPVSEPRLRSSEPVDHSPSPGSRPHRNRHADADVHLHISLTDSQMDKLAATFAPDSPESQPPRHRRQSPARVPRPSVDVDELAGKSSMSYIPRPSQDANGRGRSRIRRDAQQEEDVFGHPASRSTRRSSPSKRNASPAKQHRAVPSTSTATSTASICERRGVPPLAPLDVSRAEQLDAPQKGVIQVALRVTEPREQAKPLPPVAAPRSPRRSIVLERPIVDESSSVYSRDEEENDSSSSLGLASISPLHIQKLPDHVPPVSPRKEMNLLRDYTSWAHDTKKDIQESPTAKHTRAHAPKDEMLDTKVVEHDVGGHRDPRELPQDVYSPFTPFFQSKEAQTVRKGTKVLIGNNGWLERTNKSPPKVLSPSKKSILDPLRRMAKEVVELADLKTSRRGKVPDGRQRGGGSGLAISLDPREQGLLFGELEYILTTALDSYISCQFNAGRLDAGKYKKIADAWQQKGRPRVVGFRYDLETQLDLVHLHVQHFKFYGHQAGMTAAAVGILEMMKVDARVMRIRTFCQPDTVIAKQLIDAQHLFNMIGCPEMQQIQLAEVIQFFKTVLEREKHFHSEARMSRSSSAGKSFARG